MKLFFVLFVLLGVMLTLGAGCTQAVPQQEHDSSRGSPLLETVALTADDAPPGFSRVESRAKTAGEVGELARNLGWQAGWIVRYSGKPETLMNGTEIVQTITVYPAGQMGDIVALVYSQDRQAAGEGVKDLAPPAFGENHRAFSTTAGDKPMAQIIFSKESYLVVLKMSGAGSDYGTLVSLAESADTRIP